jgi:hypothetical protein
MPIYKPEQIQTTQESFKNLGYRQCDVVLDGRKFQFYEVPQDRNPALPCFAIVLAGMKDEGYVIGVSDLVEEAFKPLWAFHEYVEVVEPGADKKIRCIDALKQELDVARIILAKEDQLPKYIRARKEFFENLVNYVMERPAHYNASVIPEFKESLEHLISIEAGL